MARARVGRGYKIRASLRMLSNSEASYVEGEDKNAPPCEKKKKDKKNTSSEWVININEFLNQGKTFESGRSWTIFKVPTSLSQVQTTAFHTKIISIGLLNYKSDDPMYDHKMRYLIRLLGGKVGEPNEFMIDAENESQSRQGVRLEKLVEAMKELVSNAMDCYSEPLYGVDRDKFAITMVTDGCFIIELLRLHYEFMTNQTRQRGASGSSNYGYPVLNTRWQLPSTQRDLIKLENQLPFFVLETLFDLTKSENETSLLILILSFFRSMLVLPQKKSTDKLKPDPIPQKKYAHLLDVFRSSFIFSIDEKLREKEKLRKKERQGNAVSKLSMENPKLIYSAQQLGEAGVSFIAKEEPNLLDIDFEKADLQIPPLSIDENMTTVLLNFVAYEQCDQSKSPCFTNYLLFLDSLINTTKDVEILRKNGIIKYPVGTEKEVLHLFNNFCKEMLYDFDQTYLSVDMNDVNKYCRDFYESNWRFQWSNLKKERFSSPWTFLSLLAAIVLLILTLLQTIYTMVSYHHPN